MGRDQIADTGDLKSAAALEQKEHANPLVKDHKEDGVRLGNFRATSGSPNRHLPFEKSRPLGNSTGSRLYLGALIIILADTYKRPTSHQQLYRKSSSHHATEGDILMSRMSGNANEKYSVDPSNPGDSLKKLSDIKGNNSANVINPIPVSIRNISSYMHLSNPPQAMDNHYTQNITHLSSTRQQASQQHNPFPAARSYYQQPQSQTFLPQKPSLMPIQHPSQRYKAESNSTSPTHKPYYNRPASYGSVGNMSASMGPTTNAPSLSSNSTGQPAVNPSSITIPLNPPRRPELLGPDEKERRRLNYQTPATSTLTYKVNYAQATINN